MRAMILPGICDLEKETEPLVATDLPIPQPAAREILVEVSTCGVCHTELDEIEGRTPPRRFPIIPGHQIVGSVVDRGAGVRRFNLGDRVGIAWIYSACGTCGFCTGGQENLCASFRATGRDANGGYAEYTVVSEDFAYPIPSVFSDVEAAPLLCAGAIGYRSLMLTGLPQRGHLGLTGFGASGHIVMKLVKSAFPEVDVFVFARSPGEREFAMALGAAWAGDTDDTAPERLDAVIDTTPAWKPVVAALKNLSPAGRLVINAIRKERGDISYLTQIEYDRHLWLEKEIKTVANITRKDVVEFLSHAAAIPIKADTETFALQDANRALYELKRKRIRGAKVLVTQQHK